MRYSLLLLVVLGCADSQPPTWGTGAALTASEVETTSVVLAWGEASDDEALRGYELRRDGEPIETFGTDVREHPVSGLADATTYAFSVVAKDVAGNPSEPLHVEVTTLDGTPPTFPANARVVAVPNEDGTRVTLSWPEGVDNVGVARYELHYRGEPAGQTETTTIELEGGVEGWRVFAVDARGNASTAIVANGDAAARADTEPRAASDDAVHPDVAPVRIELSPAVQRAVQRTQATTMINARLRVNPDLTLR